MLRPRFIAKRVFAVDVGSGLLHWKLRGDPRVSLLEGVNARRLQSMIDFLKYACPPGGLRDRAEARFKWEKAQGADDANAYQAADQMLESMARRREAQVQVLGKGERERESQVVGRVRRKEGLDPEKSQCDAHCL